MKINLRYFHTKKTKGKERIEILTESMIKRKEMISWKPSLKEILFNI